MNDTDDQDVRQWLENSPVDWVQTVSCRSALRLLPTAVARTTSEWLQQYALSLFRAGAVSWGGRFKLPDSDRATFPRAAADAAFAVRVAARAAANLDALVIVGADSMANAADAARADDHPPFAAKAASSILSEGPFEDLLTAFRADQKWLEEHSVNAVAGADLLSSQLASTPLWNARHDYSDGQGAAPRDGAFPLWFGEAWNLAQNKLSSRDENYDVWIQWFQGIIDGSLGTFSKNTLVNASTFSSILGADDKFWTQSDRIVNSTIKAFIEDVEIEEQLKELIQRANANLKARVGTQEEKLAREKLAKGLRALANIDRRDSSLIGHNMPPEPMEWDLGEVIVRDAARSANAAAEELTRAQPQPVEVIERVSFIRRALKRLSSLSGKSADKAAEEVGKAIGETTGGSIKTIMTKAAVWLGKLLTGWIFPS